MGGSREATVSTGRLRERRIRGDALFVVPDRELQMPGHDTLLLVVPRSVARELKDFSRQVLEDSRKVD